MTKLSKFSRTFGAIFGAALIMSGANTLISNHTSAPSIASYSLTHDLTVRLIAVAAQDGAKMAEDNAMLAVDDAGFTVAITKHEAKTGS